MPAHLSILYLLHPVLEKHLLSFYHLSVLPILYPLTSIHIYILNPTQHSPSPCGTKLIEDDWFFPGCSDPALATRQQELEEELAQAQGLGHHRAKKLAAPAQRSLQVGGQTDSTVIVPWLYQHTIRHLLNAYMCCVVSSDIVLTKGTKTSIFSKYANCMTFRYLQKHGSFINYCPVLHEINKSESPNNQRSNRN